MSIPLVLDALPKTRHARISLEHNQLEIRLKRELKDEHDLHLPGSGGACPCQGHEHEDGDAAGRVGSRYGGQRMQLDKQLLLNLLQSGMLTYQPVDLRSEVLAVLCE